MNEARASIGLLIVGLILFGTAAVVAGMAWRPVVAVVATLVGLVAVLSSIIAAGQALKEGGKH